MIFGQETEDMNVIIRTSIPNCGGIVFVKDTDKISMHSFSKFIVD